MKSKMKGLDTDDMILKAVSSVLKDKTEIDSSEVEINVKDGVVILEGSVESLKMKKKIDKCLHDLSHIEIQNNLSPDGFKSFTGPLEAVSIDLGLGTYGKK